jgi:hypothetical protein
MLAIKRPVQTYLPRTQAMRASAHLEMGYGSHYHTGRFQPKRGPAIAAVAAFGAIGTGISIGVTTLAGALTIAGGVASLVGGLTGNKFLTRFGAVAGLAGGIAGTFTAAGSTGLDAFNYNPFKDGFSGTQLAAGSKKFFGDIFGSSDAVQGAGIDGNAIVSSASDSGIPSVTGDSFVQEASSSFGGSTGVDLSKYAGAGGQGVDLAGYTANAAGTVTAANTAAAASKGGLFSSLLANKDALNLVSGAADGYNAFQDRKQQQPLIDSTVDLREAQTDQTRFETNLAQNRYNNMQGQPTVNIGVNNDAQIFGNQPGSGAPRIAVAMNGKVEYLTTEQYAALQQQQQGGGGGLLQQGQANG